MKIKGIVRDFMTGEIITGATISITKGATSDINGKYLVLYRENEIDVCCGATGYRNDRSLLIVKDDEFKNDYELNFSLGRIEP